MTFLVNNLDVDSSCITKKTGDTDLTVSPVLNILIYYQNKAAEAISSLLTLASCLA